MIYLITIWLVLLFASSIVGTGLLRYISPAPWRQGDQLILALWLGTIGLAVSCLLVSFWLPLVPVVGLLILLVWTIVVGWSEKNQRRYRSLWQSVTRRDLGLCLAAIALVAALMSRMVTWHDAGFYHASVIRWFSQYGTVPGLALLFSNLGFTSSWFALVSPLSLPTYVGQTSAVGNGFAALIAVLHWMMVSQRAVRGRAWFCDWFILIFYTVALPTSLFVSPFAEIMVSPSPDFPVLLLVGTIGWAILLVDQMLTTPAVSHPENLANRSAMQRMTAVPFALGLGAMAIKLTAIPTVLLGGLFFLLSQRGTLKRLGLGGVLGLGLMGPNILASIRTSGCPLYPSAVLCTDLPWSPTAQAAKDIAASTHDWVSWLGQPPADANPWLWAVTQLVKTPRDLITFLLVGLAVLAGLVVLVQVLRKFSLARLPGPVWVVLLGIVGLGFLFLTSIFTRFLFPYMLLLFALAVTWLGHETGFGRRLGQIGRSLLAYIPLSLNPRGLYFGMTGLATVVLTVSLVQHQGQNALLPPPMIQSPMLQKVTNSIGYNAPRSGNLPITIEDPDRYKNTQIDRCWAVAIPCAYEISPDVQLRDPAQGLAAGFVRRSAMQSAK